MRSFIYIYNLAGEQYKCNQVRYGEQTVEGISDIPDDLKLCHTAKNNYN